MANYANVKAAYSLSYWDGASWVDITADAIKNPLSAFWGLADNKPLTLLADTGQLTFTLDNTLGKYIPELGTTATGWARRTPIILTFTYDGISYIRYRGRIDTITIHSELTDVKNVDVSCLDWLDFAAKYPLDAPQVAYDISADTAISTIIAVMPLKPMVQDLFASDYKFPSLFDAVSTETTAYEEFNKLIISEIRYCYLKHDKVYGETLKLEEFDQRKGTNTLSAVPKMKVDCGFILQAGNATDYILQAGSADKLIPNLVVPNSINNIASGVEAVHGDNVINRVIINTYPKVIDTVPVVLYKLGHTPLKIASGATKKIKGIYTNPNGGKEVSGVGMIDPVATTDYLMNTRKDGLGIDITANLVIVCTYSSARPNYELTNTYTQLGYVTKLVARGCGIYQDDVLSSTIEDTISQELYGVQKETLEQPYQQDTDVGNLVASRIVEWHRKPHTIINKITFDANHSTFAMQAFLTTDVGSLVQVIDTLYGINDYFYVQGVNLIIYPAGRVTVTWTIKSASSILSGGLLPLQIDFAVDDAIDFGVLPEINSLTEMTVAFSINPNNLGSGAEQVIFSAYDDSVGFYAYYNYATEQIYFKTFNFDGSGGNWYQSGSTTPVMVKTHFIVTYDLTSLTNPIMYKNGLSTAITQLTVPSGNYRPPTDNKFILGNSFNASSPYTHPFYGSISDFRFYDRIVTPAEALVIYNGGVFKFSTVPDGLIFQGPCVRANEILIYKNKVLTEGTPVLDNVRGHIGMPVGTPIGQIVVLSVNVIPLANAGFMLQAHNASDYILLANTADKLIPALVERIT